MLKRFEVRIPRVELEMTGRVTMDELLDASARIRALPAFPAITEQRWYFDQSVEIVADAQPLERALEQRITGERLPHPHLRLAIVAGSEAAYGLGRVYQAYAADAPWETRVFYDPTEAERWLTEERG